MSHPNRPSTSPRRSQSAFLGTTPPLSSPIPRGRAESSASSSDSSWTIQTPQSPSIMAVLDLGRKRAGSYPLSGHGHQELFENSLSHRESSGSIRDHDQDELDSSARHQTLSGSQSFNVLGLMNTGSHSGHANGHSNSEAEFPSVEHHIALSPEELRNATDDAKPTVRHASRTKRAIPTSQPFDGGPAEQSDDSGAKQGRRLRPRLRAILSAPLASSPHSSRTSLAKLAGALSSQKPSVESDLHTTVNHSPAGLDARQDSQPNNRATETGTLSTRLDKDTIWVQTKTHSLPAFGANPPKSPIPANRSIPPTLQRGVSSPIPALPQLTNSFAVQDSQPKPRLDHFERILPRELKVMIMGKFLEMGAMEERDRRWSGIVGARRELIRLSRVSKSWRQLCFDGQLWVNVDLTPFAAHLHSRTIRHILNHTAPFISNLSLRRLPAISSSDILSSLIKSGSPHAMATLTTLDLRCSKLESRAIISIIQNAPRLRAINLKGVQSVTSDVLYHLATYSKDLESLDVSGCWNLCLEDVQSYVETLDAKAAAGLKVLRLTGLRFRTEGLNSADTLNPFFDKLCNLETLSLQGCRQITSTMLINACEALGSQSRQSKVRHLNLSGCTALRADIFPAMSGLFPELQYLELAGMPGFFQENSQSDRTAFNRFLETLPNLEKLDIEETCGTCLDDSTLGILARAPNLTHLQIGFASKITPGAMIGFIRACPTLQVFEADNTQANGAVIREFQYRHPENGRLSLIDCRAISAADYLRAAGVSRPRDGFTGYAAIPMGYSPSDLQKKVVIKAFWSWRRVEIARGWRETLAEKERELAQSSTEAGMVGGQKGGRAGRGRGWRRKDDSYDAKGLCVVQ